MIKRFKCSKCNEKFSQHIPENGYPKCPECGSRDVLVHEKDYSPYQQPWDVPHPNIFPNTTWDDSTTDGSSNNGQWIIYSSVGDSSSNVWDGSDITLR